MPAAWPALVASTIRRLAHETLDPMFAQLKPESTRVRGRTRMLARTHGYLLHARAMHMLAFTSPAYACADGVDTANPSSAAAGEELDVATRDRSGDRPHGVTQ